ncbi:choice-of-anchor N protein [PVC group bacterium]|nr:choice-of-anchor N protein [PVC group bacterium]
MFAKHTWTIILATLFFLNCMGSIAWAIPKLQLYSDDGSVYGNINGTEDSWIQTSSQFDLTVAGHGKPARGPHPSEALLNGYLFISVLESEIGFGQVKLNGNLLSNFVDAPNLTNPIWEGPNHYPLNATDVFDFAIYALGNFAEDQPIHDFDPLLQFPNGSFPIAPNILGEEIIISVEVNGLSFVHFDAFAYLDGDFIFAPPSHNALYDPFIPEPTSLLLVGSGLLGMFGFRRKSN